MKLSKKWHLFLEINGSQRGKDTGGSDIFIDIYEESEDIQVNFLSPDSKNLLVEEGDEISINLIVNKTVNLNINIDDFIFYDSLTNELDTSIIASGSGNHFWLHLIFLTEFKIFMIL
ncbi:MAG: hypothetical protein R2771_13420 [Saprospiraceae bacterium]